jgi:hypothetical protein
MDYNERRDYNFDSNDFYQNELHFANSIVRNIKTANIQLDDNLDNQRYFEYVANSATEIYRGVKRYLAKPLSCNYTEIQDPIKFLAVASKFYHNDFALFYYEIVTSFAASVAYFDLDFLLVKLVNFPVYTPETRLKKQIESHDYINIDFDLKKIIGKSGLYLFYTESKDLLYIGRSKDLSSRVMSSMFERNRNDKIVYMRFLFTSLDDSFILEPYYISLGKPKLNVQFNSKETPTTLSIIHNYEFTEFIKLTYHE